MGLVGTPRQAQKQIDAGVDVIIAQGYDAAGHTGQIGTLSIVPRWLTWLRTRAFLYWPRAGSPQAVIWLLRWHWEPTASGPVLWLTSRESDVNQPLKERLIECETTDTVYSDCISGYTMRTTAAHGTTNGWDRTLRPY